MEVSGRIKKIGEVQTFDSGFKKRELIVTTEEQYPQHIAIEFMQDKCDLLNNFSVGTDVKVSINLRGREWINPQGEAKYFNTLQGWRIEVISAQPVGIQSENQEYFAQNNENQSSNQKVSAPPPLEDEDDDLPF